MDRGEAIRRARQLSAQYGVDTTGWPAIAAQMVDETLHRYFNEHPGDPGRTDGQRRPANDPEAAHGGPVSP